MKTQFGDPNYAKRVALLTAQAMHVYPPSISFKKKKKDKKELDFKNIDVPLDAANPDDTTEWNVPMFETGDPEEWIKWKIYFDKLEARYPLDTSDKQNNMLLTLLQGEAYDVYTTEFADGIDKARTEDQKKNLVKKALNAVAMNIFDDDATAWRRQKSYMRYNLYFEQGELKAFKLRLYELNKYLKYFPVPAGKTKVDNGGEFKWLFKELCDNIGLKKKPSNEYNPQSNSILERVHQVVGNCLRTFELTQQEIDEQGVAAYEPVITATAYAIRSTYHTTLKATPGQLVFGRDMILPIQFKADWAAITARKQALINKNNLKENKSRLDHQYNINDQVLLTKPGIVPKLDAPRTGPYKVVQVHENGNVTIQKSTNVTQRINIRRLLPYYSR